MPFAFRESVVLLLSVASVGAQSQTDFDYESAYLQFKNASVTQEHFTNVQDGAFRFFLTTDCLQIITEPSPFGIPGTCWAQNPDAPYGLLMLNITDEEPDAYSGYPLSDFGGRSATWHMKPNAAIVLLGRTPPPCRYFGFTNYLYSRYSPPDFVPDPSLGPITGRACLPGAENERCEYFASISDTVNIDRGINLPPGDARFNASFALIISPSDSATALVTAALQESGVDLSRISNFSMPGDLQLGTGTHADTFTTILRTAFYDDASAKENFFDDIPFRVLRMDLKDDEANTLHDRAPYIPRATGVRSDGTAAGLSIKAMRNATMRLAKLVLDSVTYPSPKEWEVSVTILESGEQDTGDDCINLGQRCLADCRDTLYPFTVSTYERNAVCSYFERHMTEDWIIDDGLLGSGRNDDSNPPSIACKSINQGYISEDPDDAVIVVGVNHKKANMSVYSSLAVYDLAYLWGVTGVGDTSLDGTAEIYVNQDDVQYTDPELAAALPFLYVYKIKRSCRPLELGCLAIPCKATPENVHLYIPLSHPIGFAERLYDNPESNVGASVDEIVMPVQMHVTKRRG